MSGNKHLHFRPCLSVSRYFIFINSSRNFIELYSHFVENFMLSSNNGCKFLLLLSRHILILLMTVFLFFFQLLLCTMWSILVCTINIIHIILHYVSRKEKIFCLLLWQTYVWHHVNKFLYKVSTYLNIANDCRDKNSKYKSEADPKA